MFEQQLPGRFLLGNHGCLRTYSIGHLQQFQREKVTKMQTDSLEQNSRPYNCVAHLPCHRGFNLRYPQRKKLEILEIGLCTRMNI